MNNMKKLKSWFLQWRKPAQRVLAFALAAAMIPGTLMVSGFLESSYAMATSGDIGLSMGASMTAADLADMLGDMTLGVDGATVEAGAPYTCVASFSLKGANVDLVPVNSVFVRIEIPQGAVVPSLPQYNAAGLSNYYFGDENGPVDGATRADGYIWVAFSNAVTGDANLVNFSGMILFPNGYTPDGTSTVINGAVCFMENDGTMNVARNFESVTVYCVTDKFSWVGLNGDPNHVVKVDGSDYAGRKIITTDVTTTMGTVDFVYKFASGINNSTYALSYGEKIVVSDVFEIPEYFAVTESNYMSIVSAAMATQDYDFDYEVKIIEKYEDGTVKYLQVIATIESTDKYNELKPGDLTISFTDIPYNTAKHSQLAIDAKGEFVFKSVELSDPNARSIKIYPLVELGENATYNLAQAIDGQGNDFQYLDFVPQVVYYCAVRGNSSFDTEKKPVITKSAAQAKDTTFGQIVTYTFSNFKNEQIDAMESFKLIDRVGDKVTPLGASSGYNLEQIFPAQIKTGAYSNPPQGAAAYSIIVYDADGNELGRKDDVPYNASQTLSLINFCDPSKIAQVVFDYGKVGAGFAPTTNPQIIYSINTAVANNEQIYNAVHLEYTYDSLEGAAHADVTVTHSETYPTVTEFNKVAAYAMDGKTDAITGSGNLPVAGDVLEFKLTLSNPYGFAVNRLELVEQFSTSLSPYLGAGNDLTVFIESINIDGVSSGFTDSNVTINGNTLTINFPSGYELPKNSKIVLSYKMKILDTAVNKDTLKNAYNVWAYPVGDVGPGPGYQGKLWLCGGEWTASVGNAAAPPVLAASKTANIPDGSYYLGYGSEYTYTMRLEMTKEAAEAAASKTVDVYNIIDYPQKGINLGDIVSIRVKSGGVETTLASTDYSYDYDGIATSLQIGRHKHDIRLNTPVTLSKVGDYIEVVVNAKIADSKEEFDPVLTFDTAGVIKPNNHVYFFTKTKATAGYTVTPGWSGTDTTVSGGYDKEPLTTGNVYHYKTVNVRDTAASAPIGYVQKTVSSGKDADVSSGNKSRVYNINVYNTGTSDFYITGFADVLPPYETVTKITVTGSPSIGTLTVGANSTDSENGIFTVTNFDSTNGVSLSKPIKVPAPAGTSSTSYIRLTVTTTVDAAKARAFLEAGYYGEREFMNTAYVFTNVPVKLDTTKATTAAMTQAVNTDGFLNGLIPETTVGGKTITADTITEDTTAFKATVPVTIFRNRAVPTTSIWPMVNGSIYKGDTVVADSDSVNWKVHFGNPKPATAALENPMLLVILPKDFGYTPENNSYIADIGKPQVLYTEDGRVALLWKAIKSIAKESKITEGWTFDIVSDKPTGLYGQYEAEVYLIPKATQQTFSFQEVDGNANKDSLYSGIPIDGVSNHGEGNLPQLFKSAGAANAENYDSAYLLSGNVADTRFVWHKNDIGIFGPFACVSIKTVTEDSDTSNTINSISTQRYIDLADQHSEFTYKLEVENKSSNVNYTDIVVIDRLPAIGDIGVASENGKDKRGSDMAVELLSTNASNFTVKFNGQTLSQGEYDIKFANVGSSHAFSASDWGYDKTTPTALSNIWQDSMSVSQASAIRIEFTGKTLPTGGTIEIEFGAKVTVDSKTAEGMIAYNSFGYHFNAMYLSNNYSFFPEPRMVGVRIDTMTEGDKITIAKDLEMADGSNTIDVPAEFDVPDERFYFTVYASKDGAPGSFNIPVCDENNPVEIIVRKENGKWVSDSKEIATVYRGYKYEVKELETSLADPDAYTVIGKLTASSSTGNDWSFTLQNVLDSKSVSIVKIVENAGENADISKTFKFELYGYDNAELDGNPAFFYNDIYNKDIEVTVAWNAATGKWESQPYTVNGLPANLFYDFVEIEQAGYIAKITSENGIEFTAVNTPVPVYLDIEKIVADTSDDILDKTFKFTVTPIYSDGSTGATSAPVSVTVAKNQATGEWKGSYSGNNNGSLIGPYPAGTTFTVGSVVEITDGLTDKYHAPRVDMLKPETDDANGRAVYRFSVTNTPEEKPVVYAKIIKQLNDTDADFDREFSFTIVPSNKGAELPSVEVKVTVDESRRGESAKVGPYAEGTTFTVTENIVAGGVTRGLNKYYKEPEITMLEPVVNGKETLYQFNAVNNLLEKEIYVDVEKLLRDTADDYDHEFTVRIIPIFGGERLAAQNVTITVDASRTGVSERIGPFAEGTTFEVTEIMGNLSKAYLTPVITGPSITAEGNNYRYSFTVENRLPGDEPKQPEEPENPENPEQPEQPEDPGQPVGPVWPWNPPTDDDDDDSDYDSSRDDPSYGGGTTRFTSTIEDLPVPLAALPGLTTILDGDVPLGDLPTTGATKALQGVGMFAVLALLAGTLLRLTRKMDDEG